MPGFCCVTATQQCVSTANRNKVIDSVQEAPLGLSICMYPYLHPVSSLLVLIPHCSLFYSLPQMSWNGSEQLEKAMEEVLDDDDEVKVEKSSVEKMEKHSDPEIRVLGPGPAGKDSCFRSIYCHCVYMEVVTICLSSS